MRRAHVGNAADLIAYTSATDCLRGRNGNLQFLQKHQYIFKVCSIIGMLNTEMDNWTIGRFQYDYPLVVPPTLFQARSLFAFSTRITLHEPCILHEQHLGRCYEPLARRSQFHKAFRMVSCGSSPSRCVVRWTHGATLSWIFVSFVLKKHWWYFCG